MNWQITCGNLKQLPASLKVWEPWTVVISKCVRQKTTLLTVIIIRAGTVPFFWLAVVDQTYKFLYTNVGSPGRNHDAAVFRRSRLPAVLASDVFKAETKIFGGVSVGPVLLADQAFPLQCNLMKPFPHPDPAASPSQAFNYCLSSARRVVENAFGRLKARFRILHKGVECGIAYVNCVVRACCVLHNICEQLSDRCNVSWLEIVSRDDKKRPQPVCITSHQYQPTGVAVRKALAEYLAAN
ncbi:unnamed protein product [Ixodes hexagonus]